MVVTPEHVEIALTPAGLGSRFLAILIDSAFTMGVALAVSRLVSPFAGVATTYALFLTTSFFLGLAYHVFFETVGAGRSLGKRALGLRVVDGRGLPITVAQSLVRNALRALDSLPVFYGVGSLVSLLDSNGRRLGDFAAETLVIVDSSATFSRLPPLAERKFNSLRTPRVLRLIRHRISLEERSLLVDLCLRAESLEPASRMQLMEEVADHYRAVLGVDDPRLSGENLVRGITSIVTAPSAAAAVRAPERTP